VTAAWTDAATTQVGATSAQAYEAPMRTRLSRMDRQDHTSHYSRHGWAWLERALEQADAATARPDATTARPDEGPMRTHSSRSRSG
jgi:hypothetical protein